MMIYKIIIFPIAFQPCVFVSDSLWGSSVSVEYLNLALALLVYSVRYPALFWSTNKCIGMLFSFQLLINGLHTLLAYAGMSILYKVSKESVLLHFNFISHQLYGIIVKAKIRYFLSNKH